MGRIPCTGAVLIWRVTRSRVPGYCLSVLRNRALAEDAAQEIFLKAYQGLKRFRGTSAFSSWLYPIAVNHCRDLARRAPPAHVELGPAIEELRRAIDRYLGHRGRLRPHPLFGCLSRADWDRLHCVHAAHHLSLQAPSGDCDASAGPSM